MNTLLEKQYTETTSYIQQLENRIEAADSLIESQAKFIFELQRQMAHYKSEKLELQHENDNLHMALQIKGAS